MPAATVSGASRGNYQPRVSLRRGTPNPLASSPALVIPALSPAAEHALVQIQCSGGARFTHSSGEVMRDAQLARWGRGVRSCLTVTAECQSRVARPLWVEVSLPREGRRWVASGGLRRRPWLRRVAGGGMIPEPSTPGTRVAHDQPQPARRRSKALRNSIHTRSCAPPMPKTPARPWGAIQLSQGSRLKRFVARVQIT